uniref:RNA-directed DNA polymerase, eukaryota n=1 Tax=Tanacetum cinerariifolium TaxID=118510 RepID=A0A6L2J7J8_TANCI|nr:RNA-directed DNA polymerase, eukaryota [Tanacetum cinerariifolium]
MGSQRSNQDDVKKIFMSVFVTNFPENHATKDVWNTCKIYGQVVDAYIPNRRSKAGKRFGFVIFIKVFDVDRLVNNLCTLWVGRYKLHANVAKFQRDPVNKHSFPHNDTGMERNNTGGNVDGVKGAANLYAHVVKGNYYPKEVIDSSPYLVLDDSCLNQKEYSLCLLGKVKDFASLSKLKVVLDNEGFMNIELKYMGGVTWVELEGVPYKLWSRNTFSRIASRWGTLLNGDDRKDGCYHRKRICICTKLKTNLFKSFKVVYRGKVIWVHAKEVLGWVPDFVEDIKEESDSDEDSYKGEIKSDGLKFSATSDVEGDSDVKAVPESKFKEDPKKHTGDDASAQPKKIHMFSWKRQGRGLIRKKQTISNNKGVNDVEESICSCHFRKSEVPRTGGSIIQLMDDLVNVGQTMGYDMTGCLTQKAKKNWVKELCVSNKVNFLSLQETKMVKIELFNIKRCWGNFAFEYVYSEAVGNSGGILCVWDPNMFKKINDTVSDYFTMVKGMRSGYYGDFNEVRDKRERFGSVFNRQGADNFNSFISSAGLVEVRLGGCSFTWCHKSATKMSKLDRFLIYDNLMCLCPNISYSTLDRYLSDHWLILMREVKYDYGPVPFRFSHYWFEVDDFDKLVEDTWKEAQIIESDAFLKMLRKLRYLKVKIQMWSRLNKESSNSRKRKLKAELANLDLAIDKGDGEVIDVNRRHEVVRLLQDVDKIESLEVAQKAKIKWAIEGDENSKYYHGVLNKKGQLAIRGVLVDESILIKKMIWNERLTKRRLKGRCGTDKAPGSDGFTFGFYRRYWNLIESDVVDAISCFFQQGVIPKGGNFSFITLIPKVPNANMLKDFRPISLIGSSYKIIAKILANRLVTVLGTLVNETQSAFVADRQILDGPFILNELVQWCKKKNNQAMIFKVDFKKAYDSIRWDFLDDMLKKFRFGEKWCNWIQSCLRSSRGSVIVNGSPTKEFEFYKGLKQGDLLSRFLFILVMESLHVSFQRVVDVGLFKGIVLSLSLNISHLFYADDAIFIGQWSQTNIDTTTHVLDCFHRASGLRINMIKSKLMGISVDISKMEQAATKIGCVTLKTPFNYLGSKVGGLMSRGDSNISYVYFQSPDEGVIKALHGEEGKIGKKVKSTYPSIWLNIIHEVELLKLQGIDLLTFIHSKLGNWENTSFWEVAWHGDSAFKDLFPRMYALESLKSINVALKLSHCGLTFSFKRNPRGGAEQAQFDLLNEKVESCVLVDMFDR